MSREDVETVRAIWEQFLETGEPDLETIHPDLVLQDHDVPDAEDYRGREGFIRWMTQMQEAWPEMEFVLDDVLDAGDQVVLLLRFTGTGRRSGVTLTREDAIVYELRDGMVLRLDYFNDRGQALEFAGVKG
jgi:ketosteroid isomerase-like protein